jgi:DNA-binding GntR family transcriptional regulator
MYLQIKKDIYEKIVNQEFNEILPTSKEFLFGPLYDYLISNNILFSRFEEELDAIIPTKELKETLNLAKDVAVLKRVRKGYDISNKLIEYTINYYDASLYTYKVEVAQIEKVK